MKYLILLLCLIPSLVFAQDCRSPEPSPVDDNDNQCERHMIGIFEVCKNNGTGGGVLFQSHTPTHPYNHGH